MPFDPNTVRTLLNDLGEEVTFKSYTAGTYDPTAGTNTRSSTDYTVKGYFSNYKLQDLDGDSVTLGDRKFYCTALDTDYSAIPEPKAGDVFSGVGDDVRVVSVQKIKAGTQVICYLCQVRE